MILVTGGSGFIGSNFILNWISSTVEPVVNIDKLTYAGNLENLRVLEGNGRYKFFNADIADGAFVAGILNQYKPRAVINFAAESHVDRSITAGEEFIQTNVVGVFRLLEAIRPYWAGMEVDDHAAFRFLQISTDEVYGSLGSGMKAFVESDRYEPNSPYSASKAAADHLVRACCRTYGLPVLTTICANNYGPFQMPEKLIPLMITRALAGKPLPVYGDGLQIRDWLHVEDHCSAIRLVLGAGQPGETYNVGSYGEMKNIDVVSTICRILDELVPLSGSKDHVPSRGYASQILYVPDRPGHDTRYAIDSTKIKKELGWQAHVGFAEGLRKTVMWYLENTDWTDQVHNRTSAMKAGPV